MEPNEIRQGNWVFEGTTPYQIDYRTSDWFHCELFEGIPITPEILEQCEFEWENDKHTHLQKEMQEGYLTLYYKEGNINQLQLYDIDGMNWFHIETSIPKYLHQLQNLYFALTGEELEIKELVSLSNG